MYVSLFLVIQIIFSINNITCTGCIKNNIYLCDICNYNNTIYKPSNCTICYNKYPCNIDTGCYNCNNCTF